MNTFSADTTLVMLDHLSGYHKGTRDTLMAEEVSIGSSADVDIHFPSSKVPEVASMHARLWLADKGYHIKSVEGELLVNDKHVSESHLRTNDLIQLGQNGPLLRFRLYQEVARPYKTMREAVNDCIDCAKKESQSPFGQWMAFMRGIPAQIAQLSPVTRFSIISMMLILASVTALLSWQTVQLRTTLDEQASQLDDISMIWGDANSLEELWSRREQDNMAPELVTSIRDSLLVELAAAQARIEALEARTDAGQRIIAASSESVMFLQGAYGFVDREGEPLRIQVDEEGNPLLDFSGNPRILLGGEGPRVERFYTGTGFVVADDDYIVTNRHVALPWEYDESAQAMIARYLRPVMYRMIGYLPGIDQAFEVEFVNASETSDVAVLRFTDTPPSVQGLEFSDTVPEPGDEIIVMGYPTGVRALLARTNNAFVSELLEETMMDFWTTAERLAKEGFITPLSTRGIVGQVTDARIVYDAGTTHGGSGGPVIGLDGKVYAVNAAILRDFESSNLGVPASEALALLARVPADVQEAANASP